MKKALALAASCAVALLGVQAALADADFSDPAGDGNGAPDVTDVSIFNDAFNRIVVGAKIAGGKAMAEEAAIFFWLNTDKNWDTGDGGFDHAIVLGGDRSWAVHAWDGSQWAKAPAATAKAYFVGDIVLFGIDRSELGNTAALDFYVEGTLYSGDAVVATDVAPDGDAVWSYSMVTKAFGLFASSVIVVTKGGAQAGKPFVVGYLFGRTDSPEPTSAPKSTCVATLAGKRIAARTTQQNETAACRVSLPRAAKGKVLKLTLTTTSGGKKASKTYSTKVR